MNALVIDDEPLARSELKYLLEQCYEIDFVDEGANRSDMIQKFESNVFHVVFLDVQLRDESGLDLAKQLNQLLNPPMIVFATAYDEYAVKAFERNATDYILKPFELNRIRQTVSRVNEKYLAMNVQEQHLNSNKKFPIHMHDRIILVDPIDIFAIEVQHGETTIYTKDKEYKSNEPLTLWEKRLNKRDFIRVHRSFMLRIDTISEIQPWFNHTYQVTLNNGLNIPIGRSYLKEFRNRIGF